MKKVARAMESKPIWIICSKEWAGRIRNNVGIGWGCPPPLGGCCPKEENGDKISCRKCWAKFVDFEITDEEGDAE